MEPPTGGTTLTRGAAGLLGSGWADGDEMNQLLPSDTPGAAATLPSILEPEVPAGGIVVVLGARRRFI